ncbi:BppU family phage baseplate upper protein [Staphylococcus aureus]|uniref:BppU family phage baseplate upper protein n=1 Tax=Staphylococcus aureus TaxID=1280 RepID=UPI002175C295|nr:BppU family phage baseplate upper protein [Staphylococcus aureus]MCS5417454.1 BppU family phage baseplate upper protein [Staphylococcus aureus]
MYKIKDIETRINNKTVDIGDIGCRFYTEDENTAYVRIGVNDEKGRINFKESNLTPKLHLFTEDGSIFKNESVLIDDNVKGFLTYKIPKNVIKHVGMVRCNLFLENDYERIHVANFHFYIIDSGIDDTVQKEVSITLVEDTVKRIIRTNASELLGEELKESLKEEAKQFINDNSEMFKGERGETLKEVSILDGVTGLFIGDSITEVNFRTKKNYHQFIDDRTGMKNINMGISGTGYQDRRNVACEIAEQPDFISIFLGTNDWGLVGTKLRKLGDPNNIEKGTVVSNIYYLYKQLTERFPYTPIVVLTPLPRAECNPNNEVPNKAGYSLGQLVEAIQIIAGKFALPVLDLYHMSNLKVWENAVNKEMFAYAPGKEDGLHPNAKGHEFISYTIQSFYERFAIVKPKIQYHLDRPETVTLNNGAKVTYAIPYNIFWKKNRSVVMNFKTSEIDLTDKKVLKIESNGGSLINSNGVLSNSPYWVTNTEFTDGTNLNRSSEVDKFMKTLEEIDYSSERGFEYLPQVFKITYIDKASNTIGIYSSDDGIENDNTTNNTEIDVDSPTYKTPRSDKPDEKLSDGKIATYLYPKRIFWIKGQSFAINFDPFDKDFNNVYISSIEYNGSKIGVPSSTSSNTPAYYQLNNYEDGNNYNRLTEITNFTKNLPISKSTASRIDYKQVELKVIYSETPIKAPQTNTTNPTTTQPVTPTKNSDGTYTVTLIPAKTSWKEDQSFVINVDAKAISLQGKSVLKVETKDSALLNASSTQADYFYWYTVPTYSDGNAYNRSSEVKDFIASLKYTTTDTTGRKIFENVELKITYK